MSDHTIGEHTVEVVTTAFVVIIGVAVERFLRTFPLSNDHAFQTLKFELCRREKEWQYKCVYWMSYVLCLSVIVTLVLRFLLGSDFQLREAYFEHAQPLDQFIWDIIALMFFGGFIVRAALDDNVRGFAWWLACCSGVGAVWSWFALHRVNPPPQIFWWLKINLVQFVIAFVVAVGCEFCRRRNVHKFAFATFVSAALVGLSAWFLIIFPLDLHHIFDFKP